MQPIPDEYHDLFEKATFAHVVTELPDGRPHATPVWVDYDNESDRLLVNTERHRRKARYAESTEDPQVAASMTDPEDPYRYLSVTGPVTAVTTEGAREHIDELAGRYLGEAEYPQPIESERVVLEIRPEEVFTGP